MNDREVMQMALTKLEQLRVTIDGEWGHCRDLSEIDTAGEQWPEVTALRAALAEPEQEPVAWQWLDSAHFRKKIPDSATPSEWRPLYTTPPARRPLTPAQEAAPELLEACRTLTGMLATEDWIVTLRLAVEQASAAIAKATGGKDE